MAWYLGFALLLFTVVAMEGIAWLLHKYILHGLLWFVHKSHHGARKGWWEDNDWVGVFYAVLSAGLVVWGDLNGHFVFWIGLGIAVYGLLYFILHDVLVHQRVKLRWRPTHPYLRRLIRAHKIHHKHLQREHSEAFGFLFAPSRYADN